MLLSYRAALVLFALGVTALFVPTASTQDTKEDASLERMRKDVTYLASDECEGRGVGTKGLDKAADYIADQFKKAGLKPGGVDGTYFQPFPFATNAQLDGESELILQGPKDKKIALKQGAEFQIMGTSAAAKLSAPLVFVGYGVTARGIEYDDYAGVDVKGKIVIALRRLPRWNDKDKPFDGIHKEELAALEYKHQRAQAAKAAGILLVNDSIEANDALIPFGNMAKGIITVSIPYGQIKRAQLDMILQESAGKKLADIEKAIDESLKPQSVELKGWRVAMDLKVKRQETPVKNVIALLEGKGPRAKEIVVVGGHYDHLGFGGAGSLGGAGGKGKIHHGADDNASGTSAVIELARRFAARKDRDGRTMVFMTFTAEERGLIGSRHYCRVEPLFPIKDTVAMFNLDMVGRLKEPTDEKKSKLLAIGIESGKGFEELVNKHNADFDVTKDRTVFGASDHFSFYQQRIPVLFFWTGTHPDYHRPSDTSDKINVAGMKRITDYSERIVNELRTQETRPEYVPIKTTFTPGAKGPRLGIVPDYMFGGKGVRAEDVSAGGPADMAGLKKNDVIVQIAGMPIANLTDYQKVMASQKVNTTIEIRVLRDSKEVSLKVMLK